MADGTAVLGWAARDPSGHLSPYSFKRRVQKEDDVTIKVLFCGICHTDLHVIKNEWGNAMYPVVPGHEIVGVVSGVGGGVTKFKAGDMVGVGYFVNSCGSCDSCGEGYDNYCPTSVITSNGTDYDGATTRGGFSDVLVVKQDFVVRVPGTLPPEGAAPLLCAGVTVYSPMVEYGLNAPGKHLGVVGLGGLGHLGVKFGKAFGMKVTVISTSPSKREEALERLGAPAVLPSRGGEEMAAAAATMDGIIDTVSAGHPLVPLLSLLKPKGQMVVVGAPSTPLQLPAIAIIDGGKRVAGSGGQRGRVPGDAGLRRGARHRGGRGGGRHGRRERRHRPPREERREVPLRRRRRRHHTRRAGLGSHSRSFWRVGVQACASTVSSCLRLACIRVTSVASCRRLV
uniref:cinnamyl-alcohol dehydrogenase n=1 Tax=Oryza brachyantha TaxID=4533 RepID=J3MX90_ORYBR